MKKADEWCCLTLPSSYPVLLWWAWQDDNGNIPDSAPPLPPNAVNVLEHLRNTSLLYSAILLLCADVRILASQTISMAQARIGQNFLMQYSRALLQLNVHLVINHHMSMHYLRMIKLLGPVYSWWLFAFERFNGMLERVKTNGKDGGRSEQTLLRNWVMTHLVYELLLSLPDNAHPLERKLLHSVIQTQGREQGTMMAQIAIYRAEARAGFVIPYTRKTLFFVLIYTRSRKK